MKEFAKNLRKKIFRRDEYAFKLTAIGGWGYIVPRKTITPYLSIG